MDSSLNASTLEALLESAQLLHSSLDADDLLKHLLRSVMGRLVVGRGLVAIREGEAYRVAQARGCKGIKAGDVFDELQAAESGLSLVIPIATADRAVGVLALATPPAGVFAYEDRAFLDALAGIAASGIENADTHTQVRRLNDRLDQKIHELRTLLELVRALSSAGEPEEVAHLLALTLSGRWALTRYAVFAGRRPHAVVSRQKGIRLEWDESWTGELEALPDALVIDEAAPPSPLIDALRAQKVALVLPMRSGETVMGFAALGSRPGGRVYGEADRDYAAGVVAQAAVAFENAFHQREVVERKQFERELTLAATIQKNLFPSELPVLMRCDLAATNRPARLVGGDYYDALTVDAPSPAHRCLLCVADVSGKGIGASLVMSNMQATLRALLGREASLAELARCTNELLHSSTPDNKYATAILLTIEPFSGKCCYVNAGHTESLVIRPGGTVERLPPTGLPLGLFSGMPYASADFETDTGDVIVLYSDGVSEAMNADDEEYGIERLVAAVRRAQSGSAADMLAAVMHDVDVFVAGAPQHDDITLLILKRV